MKMQFYPDEHKFILDNRAVMTNEQMRSELNCKRAISEQMTISQFRHTMYKYELTRSIQIRWSDSDIEYLINNYQKYGNIELANKLNKRRKTFRIINGKKVYRVFTESHIQKKLNLLKLKRSENSLNKLRKNNKGCFTPDRHVWNTGKRKALEEKEIVIRKVSGRSLQRFIKINGRLIVYSRWFYHNFISPIPKGLKVCHKDMDQLNDNPENLILKSYSKPSNEDYKTAIQLLEKKVPDLQKQTEIMFRKSIKDYNDANKNLIRVVKLIEKLKNKLK